MDVGSHSSDLVNHVVLDPVVILEVQTKCALVEVLTQVFLVENCAVHAFQVFDFLPVVVLVKFDVVQCLYLTLAVRVIELVRILTKEC